MSKETQQLAADREVSEELITATLELTKQAKLQSQVIRTITQDITETDVLIIIRKVTSKLNTRIYTKRKDMETEIQQSSRKYSVT